MGYIPWGRSTVNVGPQTMSLESKMMFPRYCNLQAAVLILCGLEAAVVGWPSHPGSTLAVCPKRHSVKNAFLGSIAILKNNIQYF